MKIDRPQDERELKDSPLFRNRLDPTAVTMIIQISYCFFGEDALVRFLASLKFVVLPIIDVCAMVGSMFIAFWLKALIPIGRFPLKVPGLTPYLYGLSIAIVLVLLVFHIFDMYKVRVKRTPLIEATLAFVLISSVNTLLMGATFLYRGYSFSRLIFFYFWVTELLLVCSIHAFFRLLVSRKLNGGMEEEKDDELPPPSPPRRNKRLYFFFKRLMDVSFSFFGLLLLSPLFLFIGVLVRLTSKGPVFFCREGIGKDGKRFQMLKFRSMYADAEERLKKDPTLMAEYRKRFKIENDPRVTRVGRFLRRTSIDELPQLINVLVGEMSLVGPRPVAPDELALHRRWKGRLLEVRPGITGMWQVSGRDRLSYEERVKYNIYYIKHCSLYLDMKILLKTFAALLRTEAAG